VLEEIAFNLWMGFVGILLMTGFDKREKCVKVRVGLVLKNACGDKRRIIVAIDCMYLVLSTLM